MCWPAITQVMQVGAHRVTFLFTARRDRPCVAVEWTRRRSLGALWEGQRVLNPLGESSICLVLFHLSISLLAAAADSGPSSFPPCVCASGAFALWQRARAQRDRAISIRATLIMPGCNLRGNTRIRENRAITAAIAKLRMSRDSRAQISSRSISRINVTLRYSREPCATFRRLCTCSVLFIFPRVRYSSSSKRMTVTNESKFRKMNFSRH